MFLLNMRGFLFSKKKNMEKKHSPNEKLLYHGTSYDVTDAIRFQNFDFRLCGKNATRFGKVQATVIIIHNLILKVITTCLLHKFSLEDIQW